jgi:nucleoside-diphosphate-sugar epimerase
MIYVSDVAEGLRLCAEREQNFVFSAMNLGTCTSVTNNQILQMLQDLVENFEIQQAPVRPGDVRHTLLDIVKVANETGWKANITLEEGLRRTLEWWGIPLRK